jgi:hypothetical protein
MAAGTGSRSARLSRSPVVDHDGRSVRLQEGVRTHAVGGRKCGPRDVAERRAVDKDQAVVGGDDDPSIVVFAEHLARAKRHRRSRALLERGGVEGSECVA